MSVARRQSGIALLLVLWVLVLFSGVAVSYAYGVRAEARMTRNQLEQAQAEALAEAGVARALQALTAASPRTVWDGTPQRFELAGGEVRWAARNAAGLVNLNTADTALLRGLFVAHGLGDDAAAALADAIADWRDPDDLRRLAGAEDRDYQLHGLAHGAGDAPFTHPAELQQVLGMTPDLYQALRPYLVVHGGHRGVNPRYAPRGLLLWFAADERAAAAVDEYLRQRRDGGLAAASRLPTFAGSSSSANSGYLALEVQGRTPNGARATLAAVVRPGSAQGVPQLVDWQFVATRPEVEDGG